MNANRFWNFCSADFLSPKELIRHAVLIVLAFGVAHAFGLREYTSFLNGTTGSTELGYELSALLGLIYLLLYFATVLLVPILFLAALLASLWHKFHKSNLPLK